MINVKEHENLSVINHSCAHMLAQAIKRIYPNALFWVGPVIEEGFYYDIDLGDKVITEDDLEAISKEMKKIVKEDKLIKRLELSKEEALDMFKDDLYKIDLIENMDEAEIIYAKSTKLLKHFKLLKVSGAYYKGDSNNKVLQRIYGICFETEEDLNNHLNFLEEAKKRDHRKLGKELDLFMMSEYGPGFPFFLPKGMILRNELENFWYQLFYYKGLQIL